MNQRKAKRIRSELRENLQDPYFQDHPIAEQNLLESAVKRATRNAKKFYLNISKNKRNKFEITQ